LNLTIKTLQDEKDLKNLLEFISKQEQYYPNFKDWVFGKLQNRLENTSYKSLIAVENKAILGCLVYSDVEDITYIKNFRIDTFYQNRSLGTFLLNQIVGKNSIITDITTTNFKAVEFFIKQGFKIASMEELYLKGQQEYIIKKSL